MGFKIVLVFMMLACSCIADQPLHRYSGKERVIQALFDTMKATQISSNNENTIACNKISLKNLEEISAQFDEEYERCHNVSDESMANLNELTLKKREVLSENVTEVCTSLNRCNRLEDHSQFFECYRETSTSGSSDLKSVSGKSKLEGTYYQAALSEIHYDLTDCQIDTFNVYDARIEENTRNHGVCLKLGEWPPKKTTTAVPTTFEPIITTVQPFPSESSSTDAPVEPTDEPVEPTDEPAEPTAEPEADEQKKSNSEGLKFAFANFMERFSNNKF